MDRSLTEAKVLQKLDIPDFRHLTKDKVVSFVSMLPQMNPDVAQKALEQFPTFAETNFAVLKCLKDSLGTITASNAENMVEFNARCQEALETFEVELKRENLTDESRKLVIDGIMGIISAMNQKDSENKAFLSGLFTSILIVGALALLLLPAPLGIRVNTAMGG